MKNHFALCAVGWILASGFVQAAVQVGSSPFASSVTGAGNSHAPVLSADRRHVAFISHANNLVTNDDLRPHLDLFLRDLVSSNTVLVSVNANGVGGGNDNVVLYTHSSNAQFVAFETLANDLTSEDTNRVADIYLRDVAAGTTRLISAVASGAGSGNGPSTNPLISDDGRYVVFESLASNLVTNDFNGTNDIFVRDLVTGVTKLVSMNAEGTASAGGASHSPTISADGQVVAFVSHATNLVEGVTNQLGEIYGRDLIAGVTRWAVASHIDNTRHRNGQTGTYGPYVASSPILSDDGRFVLFRTQGSLVRYDFLNPTSSVFRTQLITNQTVPLTIYETRLTFHDNPRLAGSASQAPVHYSMNGRCAVMETATNVIPALSLKVVDFETLATNVIVSSSCQGCSGGSDSFATNIGPSATIVLTNAIPAAGRETWTTLTWTYLDTGSARVLFVADATNLVATATNRAPQIYSLSLAGGEVAILSTNSVGERLRSVDGVSAVAEGGGLHIAWESQDSSIVSGDLNRAWDVFVRDAASGETHLVSARQPLLQAATGTSLTRLDPTSAALSGNGQRVAFLSLDNVLAPDDTNAWRDLFVHDLTTGETRDVSRSIVPFNPSGATNSPGTNTAAYPLLSADGRYVAFIGVNTEFSFNTNYTYYWRDLQASTNRTVARGNILHQALSQNGQLMAFASTDALDLGDISDPNQLNDVFVYKARSTPRIGDCQPSFVPGGNPLAISTRANGDQTGNRSSVSPAFTPDDTTILFSSLATDMVPGLPSTISSYQLYARSIYITNRILPPCIEPFELLATGPARLLSYSTVASSDPNGYSTETPLPGGGMNPRFSGDSRYVVFESGSPTSIFRHDLLAGPIVKWSVAGGITVSNVARLTNILVCADCANASVSRDGRLVAFEQRTSGTFADIRLKDLESGQIERISVGATPGGNAASSSPLLSGDGRFVVFSSKASDLVANDTNRAADIFVRDRLAGVTHCVSRNWQGTTTGNRPSSHPVMAADGRTVAFQSFAGDLLPGDYNDTRDVFALKLGGSDSDNDQLDDDWEMAYFSTLSRDGSGDFDGDGVLDRDEFRAGTDPANDASVLRVLTLTSALNSGADSRNTVVIWSAVPGRLYRLQFKATIDAAWVQVGGNLLAASTTASALHVTSAASEQGYYRVVLVQ